MIAFKPDPQFDGRAGRLSIAQRLAQLGERAARAPKLLPPDPWPREALVRVETFDWQHGELIFVARFVRRTSASHVLIRHDDGLTFIVPEEDCRAVDGPEDASC